jgi:hypothetical protein
LFAGLRPPTAEHADYGASGGEQIPMIEKDAT